MLFSNAHLPRVWCLNLLKFKFKYELLSEIRRKGLTLHGRDLEKIHFVLNKRTQAYSSW